MRTAKTLIRLGGCPGWAHIHFVGLSCRGSFSGSATITTLTKRKSSRTWNQERWTHERTASIATSSLGDNNASQNTTNTNTWLQNHKTRKKDLLSVTTKLLQNSNSTRTTPLERPVENFYRGLKTSLTRHKSSTRRNIFFVINVYKIRRIFFFFFPNVKHESVFFT